MSFNLGVGNNALGRSWGMGPVAPYLYEDIYYRQWIAEVALAFYEGRSDHFVWLDLVKQFRNPENQQILPLNVTKEIVDETAILYKEDAIYKVVDENGRVLANDQKLWDEIMEKGRYRMFMDKVDRYCRLLGTNLVKVSFVDPITGQTVKETEPGVIQFDLIHGGVYDVQYGASPYYITNLLIGFNGAFSGFKGLNGGQILSGGAGSTAASMGATLTGTGKLVDTPNKLGQVNRIFWSPDSHASIDEEGNEYKTKNPYGMIPAVPFFNQDPAYYYFLPVNEPVIYANHAINMRLTDLNHIAKFQSFGIPVLSGVERPKSIRQGRPVDDFNVLKGGSAGRSAFGGLSGPGGMGAFGGYRNYDAGFNAFRDGNAESASLGYSLGPDTAIALGEKGDFRFEHPKADIKGLTSTIEKIYDMVRLNNGLKPKFTDNNPSSGFAQMLEKMGVIEENQRRSKLFREREQQLFDVVKSLWNTHHSKTGDRRFSEKAKLEVAYVSPKFPVDPKTERETILLTEKVKQTGIRENFKTLYPYLSDIEISKKIKEYRKDRKEQAMFEAEIEIERQKLFEEHGITPPDNNTEKPKKDAKKQDDVEGVKIDNKLKHSVESSKQPGKNGDTRKKSEE